MVLQSDVGYISNPYIVYFLDIYCCVFYSWVTSLQYRGRRKTTRYTMVEHHRNDGVIVNMILISKAQSDQFLAICRRYIQQISSLLRQPRLRSHS